MGKRKAADYLPSGSKTKKSLANKEANNTIEQIDGLIEEVKSLMNSEQLIFWFESVQTGEATNINYHVCQGSYNYWSPWSTNNGRIT